LLLWSRYSGVRHGQRATRLKLKYYCRYSYTAHFIVSVTGVRDRYNNNNNVIGLQYRTWTPGAAVAAAVKSRACCEWRRVNELIVAALQATAVRPMSTNNRTISILTIDKRQITIVLDWNHDFESPCGCRVDVVATAR